MNNAVLANLSLVSLMVIGGVLATGYVSFPLGSSVGQRYSLPNAQVQLVVDPTCIFSPCVVSMQPTATPSTMTATADANGIVETAFVVSSYTTGIAATAAPCNNAGSGTINVPTTVYYPPTYSVYVNGQKAGSIPNFFGGYGICGHAAATNNFGYLEQPFWLNFSGCSSTSCGVVQFAIGYAPAINLQTYPTLCYPTAISGNIPVYPGATPTNSAGCGQYELAAQWYPPPPVAATTSTSSSSTSAATSSSAATSPTTATTATVTVTTSFAYSTTTIVSGIANTTTVYQTVVVTKTAAGQGVKNSQWLGFGLAGVATIVLVGFNVRRRQS